MAIDKLLQVFWNHALLVGAVLLSSYVLQNLLKQGLRDIPGPFLAKISNAWRLWDVWKGRADITHNKLHRKYGEYVRLGPNIVSVSNLAVVKDIYGINKGYNKSNFYSVQKQMKDGKAVSTLFTSTDENFHAAIKRPISSAYSMSTLTEFEVPVNRTIEILFKRLREEFNDRENSGKICDIAKWLQFYAFDVIGELTFSRRLGFIEKGSDVGGIMAELEKTMRYNAVIGQAPWLDYLFKKNPVLSWLFKPTGRVARFAQERLRERIEMPKQPHSANRDFLDRFLDARKTHPEIATEGQILSWTITNVFAGSDTTAISLRAIIYYILKSPKVQERLQKVLETAVEENKLSYPVSWKESQDLPYLDAVIKEALRLHPAVGLPLERVVPSRGLRLPNGTFLPQGTIVGASPWVIHQNQSIFGKDVDSFIPERWLQAPDESVATWAARRQEMTRGTFTFGSGPRTCIGKNISLLEIYKLIPSLLLKFKIELVHPDEEWTLRNSWFVGQGSIPVRLYAIDDKESSTM